MSLRGIKSQKIIIIGLIIITDFYSAFRSEDTEALECPRVRSLLVKNMKSHASCYIVIFALIKCTRANFKLVTKVKHCIRQFVLQAELNAILYGYIAVCWLSKWLQYTNDFCGFKLLIY